jgi:RES domain-containing protein
VSGITVWRLCRRQHAAGSFSGEGSRLYGGRWSDVGVRVAYSSESRSLAALEVLANARDATALFALPWSMIAAEIPLELIERPARVPANWREMPYPTETQHFGSTWARESRSAALRVPSTVVLGEFNYLLNPAHPDFAQITLHSPESFDFDPRLKR